MISSKFHYIAIPHFDVGINATYLHFPLLKHKYQKRLEFEFNPYWNCRKAKIHVRNRLELRHTHGGGRDGTRFRQRWHLEWPLKPDKCTVFHNNELFYNLELKRFIQNRFIPIGIRYQLKKHIAIELYYMLRRHRSGSSWPSTHIIGISLRIGPLIEAAAAS